MKFEAKTIEGEHGELRVSLTVEENGEEVTTVTTLCGFANLLKEGSIPVERSVPAHIGRLPVGYVSADFLDNDNFTVFVERPAMKRNFYYKCAEKKYVIPFPRLLFRFQVTNGKLKSKRVVVVSNNTDLYSGDFEIFHYPFGNVGSGSDICMGSIDTSEKETFASVGHYVDMFFNSYTNDDYMHQSSQKYRPKVSQQQLIEMLEKKEEFPEEWLMPYNGKNEIWKINN